MVRSAEAITNAAGNAQGPPAGTDCRVAPASPLDFPFRLELTGEYFGRGFLVRLDHADRQVNDTQHTVLAELALAAFTKESRYLYLDELIAPTCDEWGWRTIISRLRNQLGCYEVIENNLHGGYRLGMGSEFITVHPSFWELPAGVINPVLLKTLKEAVERHHNKLPPQS